MPLMRTCLRGNVPSKEEYLPLYFHVSNLTRHSLRRRYTVGPQRKRSSLCYEIKKLVRYLLEKVVTKEKKIYI